MRKLVIAIVCAGAALALAAPGAIAASEPVASTGNATAITPTSATLNGTVNPEGQATTYYFEYGTTTAYGSQTAMTSAGAGTSAVDVSATLASLAPNTPYHYRVVATNASGTALGSDVSFKTPKPPLPVATTGHATAVTQTSATLTGTVNPEGEATIYGFQYGTSTAYGSVTPAGSAGSGTKNVAVAMTIGSLAPNTTYHYRLVATSVNGTTRGHDFSFRTAALPGGISLAASPNPVTFGQLTSLSGRVLGPRPSHPAVTLRSAPSPSGPWTDAASTTAASSGAYSFPNVFASANTYYQVQSSGASSATVFVSVRFRVGLSVSRLHPPAGSLVRFHGRVAPLHRGQLVLIQKLGSHGRWHTIRLTRLGRFGFYSLKIRIRRTGLWRVVVVPDGTHGVGRSRVVRIRVR
jgi:hypothetical protein